MILLVPFVSLLCIRCDESAREEILMIAKDYNSLFNSMSSTNAAYSRFFTSQSKAL
jgi:hypothetical protein